MKPFKTKHQQLGAGMYGAIFYVLVAVFIGHALFKLFPIYMENMAVKSVVENIGREGDTQFSRPMEVHQAIFRRLDVNNVTLVDRDNVSVVRDGEYFQIDVSYEVRVPYIRNISLLLNFEHHNEVPVR